MKNIRKFLAFVLCVCMVLSLAPAMQAAAAAAGLDESFEDCAAGAQPDGWSITSMKANSTIETENNWAANYTLEAVSGEGVDGGTAVSLTKNSVGYAALTSAPVQAQEGTAYRLSYAYKTTALEGLQATADFYGIHTVVACLDADGNLLTDGWLLMNDTGIGFGQTLSEGWETVQHDFVAVEGTASIRVYLSIGGIYYIKATVLFDDISVTAYDAEEIANGDMEAVVYEVNGGRETAIPGPSLWQTVSVNGNGVLGDTNNWQNNYVVSTVNENGNSVLKIAPKNSTRGYAVALSNYMAVEPGENYLFTYDQKLENAENEPSWGVRAYLYFFDADQNVMADATLLQTAKTGVSQDWTARELQFTAPDGAAYLKVGFYIGGVWNASSNFAYYYDDVQVKKVGLNGGFEVHTANNVLLNWSKTSMQANSTIETANDWAANYTLVAAPGQGVNGSTAASLTKNGVGYAALTSTAISAQGGTAYRLSYTFKTTSLENLQAASDFYGIHTAVQCLDAQGNALTDGWMILNNASVGMGQTLSDGWQTVIHDFIPVEGTASVRIYLSIGGIYYIKATVLFDNVTVTAYDAGDIANADFEGTVNEHLGGRSTAVEGPALWDAMTTDAGGTWNSAGSNTYVDNYIVSTVVEADGNKVMKLAPKTSTMGYAVAYSNYIAVEANTQYTLSYDQKIDLGESALQGAKIKFYYFDANKTYLGEDWYRSSTEAHDWQRMENTFTTRNNTAYIIVGFFIGGTWGQNTGLAYYYDDLALEKVIPSYKVTYIADDATVAEYTVVSGSDVSAVPEVPTKEGFVGAWDHDGKNITSDTTITAVYLSERLYQKSALFTGDSICHASDRVGWAGRIGEKYSMNYVNAGVSGASVSTVRTSRIIDQLNTYQDNTYDFVLLHGSTNDAWSDAPIGEMTDSFKVADFDVDTFAGALEELFYYAKLYFGDAKIGYIINFKFKSDVGYGAMGDMSGYVDVSKSICDKWNIPYLDLYNNEELTAALQIDTTTYLPDAVHPNAEGYDIIAPYIEAWMNDVVAVHETTPIPEYTEIKDWNITLGDDIGVNFYVNAKDEDVAQAEVKLTVGGEPKTVKLADLTANADGYYVVSKNLAAAQMTESISMELIINGETVQTGTYSVYSYAQYVLVDENSEFDEKTKAMVREMLNYGAAAQTYFAHNVDNLANAGLDLTNVGTQNIPAQEAKFAVSGKVSGIKLYGASLIFESKTAVRFYFTASNDIAGYSFKVGEKELTADKNAGMYYVQVNDIAPQDLDQIVELTVTAGDETLTVSYSPLSYMVRKNVNGSENLKALLKAMYNYHLAAAAYLESSVG